MTPDTEYDLWLFAYEPFPQNANQTVTITGGGTNPAPFTMSTVGIGSQLLVNSAIASPARTLCEDAVRTTADANGNIQISIVNNGGDFVILAGAAIQEVAVVQVLLPVQEAGDTKSSLCLL